MASALNDRQRFPTTISTGPVDMTLYPTMFNKLLEMFNWTTVGFVYEEPSPLPFVVEMNRVFTAYYLLHTNTINMQKIKTSLDGNISRLLVDVSMVSRG